MAKDSDKPNHVQEASPPITEYFARIPYAVFDARESGELTPSMFLAMVWLFKWADWETGSVQKMCAERLTWATEGEFAKRSFEEALQNLQKAGWIHSHHKQGSKRPYRVDISNYIALSGAQKNQVLNPSEIKSWREAQKRTARRPRADSAQTGRGDDREVNREVNGSPTATTMRVSSENSTRGSSENSSDAEPPGYISPEIETAKQALVVRFCSLLRSDECIKNPSSDEVRQYYDLFRKDANALAADFNEIKNLWSRVLQTVFPAPPHPTPVAPAPRKPGPIRYGRGEAGKKLLAVLTDAGAGGLSTADAAVEVFGEFSYPLRDKIVGLVSNLRRQGHCIALASDHNARKFVLRKN